MSVVIVILFDRAGLKRHFSKYNTPNTLTHHMTKVITSRWKRNTGLFLKESAEEKVMLPWLAGLYT